MNMKTVLLLTPLHALLVQCRNPTYAYTSSPWWQFANYLWPLPLNVIEKNQNPDGTVSAPLGHSLPYVVRANVSELAVAKATDERGDQISNPHVVITTFDLTYTGAAAPLNSSYVAIDGNSSVVREFWTVAYDYDFPRSTLNKYSASNPGDCTGPLGTACVRALEAHNMADLSWEGLYISAPECADALSGLSKEVEDYHSLMSPVNPVWANATDSPVLWRASAAFSDQSQDALNEELGKMQLVGITTDETDDEIGASSKVTSVLCFRVDVKAPTGAAVRSAPGLAVLGGWAMLVMAASML